MIKIEKTIERPANGGPGRVTIAMTFDDVLDTLILDQIERLRREMLIDIEKHVKEKEFPAAVKQFDFKAMAEEVVREIVKKGLA